MINILNNVTGIVIHSFNSNTISNESLKQKDFSNCSLEHLYFKQCDFSDANFSDAEIRHCVFEECDFEGAAFSYTLIEFGEIQSCSLDKIKLNHSNISFVDINETDIKESEIIFSTFTYDSIFNCFLFNSNIEDVIICNSNFSYNELDSNINNLEFNMCVIESNNIGLLSYPKISYRDCRVNHTKLKQSNMNNISGTNNTSNVSNTPNTNNSFNTNNYSNCNDCLHYSLLNGFCKYKNIPTISNNSCSDFKKV